MALLVGRKVVSEMTYNYYYYYYKGHYFVKRKIRINTPNAASQQLNRNVSSLALKTSSKISGDGSSVGKLIQTTGPLAAKLLYVKGQSRQL